MGFVLAGREASPVQVRAWKGQRVTIDGGLNIQPPSTHLWIWDLEILVSEPRPAAPVPPDPSYANVNRPWGGLNVYSGQSCKFINLVIHDNSQGVSWWTGSQDSELHGCILYDNGWAGTDRGHGHAIYTQNNEWVKTISDCFFTGGYGYTLHAYGSSRADERAGSVQIAPQWGAHGDDPPGGNRCLVSPKQTLVLEPVVQRMTCGESSFPFISHIPWFPQPPEIQLFSKPRNKRVRILDFSGVVALDDSDAGDG